VDKGKTVMEGDDPVIPQSQAKPPHVMTMVSLATSDLSAHIGKLRGRQIGRLLKLPCVTNVELAVMSGLEVLHLKRSHPGIMDLLPEVLFQGISSSKSLLQQRRFGSPRSLMWRNRRLQKGNLL
jgi:hypothetical protein